MRNVVIKTPAHKIILIFKPSFKHLNISIFSFTRLALILLAIEYFSLTILHISRLAFFSSKTASAAAYFRIWNFAFIFGEFFRLKKLISVSNF